MSKPNHRKAVSIEKRLFDRLSEAKDAHNGLLYRCLEELAVGVEPMHSPSTDPKGKVGYSDDSPTETAALNARDDDLLGYAAELEPAMKDAALALERLADLTRTLNKRIDPDARRRLCIRSDCKPNPISRGYGDRCDACIQKEQREKNRVA